MSSTGDASGGPGSDRAGRLDMLLRSALALSTQHDPDRILDGDLAGGAMIASAPPGIGPGEGSEVGEMARRRAWEVGDWPPPDRSRTRVLVESSDAADQWALEKTLVSAGYDVAVCDGPSVHGSPCPLVRRGECTLAAGADVILDLFRLDEPANQDVLRAVRGYRPATPVVVEVRPKERERHADLLEGCRVVLGPLTSRGLRDSVNDARAGTAAVSVAGPPANGQSDR